MRSNHTSIPTTFRITAIKFKLTEKIVAQTDWKLIRYHKTTTEFNHIISMFIAGSTTYSNYNNHNLEAGTNIAIFNNQRNKLCFHFSRNSLLPLIESRDSLLSDYQTLGIGKRDSS